MGQRTSGALELWLVLMLAVVAAGSMWSRFGVVDRFPEQFPDQKVTRQLRGNRSDLYPRWLGTRELILHGRDPYSAAVTAEIQRGYWGDSFDPSTAGMPKDEARFAYPLYVAFLLAPTVTLPFDAVRIGFVALLLVVAILTAGFWKEVLALRLGVLGFVIVVIVFVGSWPVSEAVHLQQLSLVVSAFIAGAVLAYVRRKYWLSGSLLALGMIKPQITVPITAWLIVRALFNSKERRTMLGSFVVVLGLLIAGSELLLPGWILRWIQATRAYMTYNESVAIPVEVLGHALGAVLTIAIVLWAILLCWRTRRAEANSPEFQLSIALILACTVALSPVAHGYDQALLFPAVALMVRSVNRRSSAETRMVVGSLLITIASIWAFAMVLATAQMLATSYVRAGLMLMLYPMVITPLATVGGLMLVGYEIGSRPKAEASQIKAAPQGGP